MREGPLDSAYVYKNLPPENLNIVRIRGLPDGPDVWSKGPEFKSGLN